MMSNGIMFELRNMDYRLWQDYNWDWPLFCMYAKRKQVKLFSNPLHIDIIKQKYFSGTMYKKFVSGEMPSWGPNLGLKWADPL